MPGFGCFLQLAHNWADFDTTKKSYELWMRHVMPEINKMNDARRASFGWATDNAEEFIGQAMSAAMTTIQQHYEDEEKKKGQSAAE